MNNKLIGKEKAFDKAFKVLQSVSAIAKVKGQKGSSKPSGGLNKAPSGFNSHTFPLYIILRIAPSRTK